MTAEVSHVAVVGGGLSGLTAACVLADSGIAVTLLEGRARLGGATFSLRRELPGGRVVVVDNGQHLVLRCYDRYLALLSRLGTAHRIRFQPRLRIPVCGPGGVRALLQRGRLPAPAHIAAAIARYRLLSVPERLQTLRTAAALVRLDPAETSLDAVSFGDWLAGRGTSRHVRHVLWDLLSVSALNAHPLQTSLALAAMVFRTAFGSERPDAADLGVPDVPLDDLHVVPAERYLSALDARVLRHQPVRRIEPRPCGWSVRHGARGEHEVMCDGVVLAVPPLAAARLLPRGALPDPLAPARLGSAPIVSLHVWLDRPVLSEPFTAAVGTDVSWVFAHQPDAGSPDAGSPDAGSPGPRPPRQQYLTVPLSAADRWMDLPSAVVTDRVVADLRRLLPAAENAHVLGAFVTRERHATFAQGLGTARLRPPARTGLPGLVLAGAWTATGWPDTLEGAVRSGESAAAAITGASNAASRLAPGDAGPARSRLVTRPQPTALTEEPR